MRLKKNEVLYFENAKIKVSLREVLHVFQYSKESAPSRSVRSEIKQILMRQKDFLKPRAAVLLMDGVCVAREGSIQVNGMNFKSKKLSHLMKRAPSALLFVATAGDSVSWLSQNAMKNNDYFSGMVYDAIGSLAAEKCAQSVQDMADNYAKRACARASMRFSPGYGDWSLREQKKIFQLLKPEKIGVRLTECFMMVPEKSVSAIIGIGNVKRINCGFICSQCKALNCPYRDSIKQRNREQTT